MLVALLVAHDELVVEWVTFQEAFVPARQSAPAVGVATTIDVLPVSRVCIKSAKYSLKLSFGARKREDLP